MTLKYSFLLVCVFAWVSGTSTANQSNVGSLAVSDNHASTTTATNQGQSTGSRSTNRKAYRNFYLINDTQPYSGDSLNISQQQYQLTRAGVESAGRLFQFNGLLLLWDTSQSSYQLLNVEAVQAGIWKSCWGQEIGSVRTCDENTESVYFFDDESAAAEFNKDGSTDDELAMGPAPESPQPEPAPAPPQTENVAQARCAAPAEELKAAILKSTNDLRAQARQCGTNSFAAASPLVWNSALAAAASRQSNDMASNNFFSHTGSDGLQVSDRATAEGYQYRYIGENIAAGQATVGVVQNGWINSPGHCRNIMTQQATQIGAACVVDSDSDYPTYWTVVVGEER